MKQTIRIYVTSASARPDFWSSFRSTSRSVNKALGSASPYNCCQIDARRAGGSRCCWNFDRLLVGLAIAQLPGGQSAVTNSKKLAVRIPGYAVIRNLTQQIAGQSRDAWKPALFQATTGARHSSSRRLTDATPSSCHRSQRHSPASAIEAESFPLDVPFKAVTQHGVALGAREPRILVAAMGNGRRRRVLRSAVSERRAQLGKFRTHRRDTEDAEKTMLGECKPRISQQLHSRLCFSLRSPRSAVNNPSQCLPAILAANTLSVSFLGRVLE